jgi:hypothetical protein
MLTVPPQFITDAAGNKISVVLSIADYEALIEELEDFEDERLYNEAKKDDDGERILFSDYLKTRKEKNG